LAGVVAAGYYCAAKFAVEGLSDAVRQEVEPLGIKVTLVEPGAFRTEWSRTANESRIVIDVTRKPREKCGKLSLISPGRQPGDPARAARAIVKAIEAPDAPRRLLLGRDAYELACIKLEECGTISRNGSPQHSIRSLPTNHTRNLTMKTRLTNLAFLRAKTGKSEELGAALKSLVQPSREDPTCFVYDLHHSAGDPDLWFVYEIWESAEALTAHFEAPFMKEFVAKVEDLLDGDIDLRAFTPVLTMKTEVQLLNEFLPLVRSPKEAVALFAEDGSVELPYLASLGMQWQYKGRAEIESLYALLLEMVPGWEFRN
jgi:quinol monooxygenase YgiN